MSAALIADKLRASLLQAAIQGKLTKQLPEDGDARDLLKEIEAEKARLIEEKVIKKEKPLPPITEEEIPFEIPENWVWVRLGDIVLKNIGGGTPSKSNLAYWNGDIFWASVKDLNVEEIYETQDKITQEGLDSSSSNLIPKDTYIICTRMGLGKIALAQTDVAINQDLRALFFSKNFCKKYFYHFYKTLVFKGKGATVKGISVDQLNNYLFPLPPLEEQHRIVEAIETALAKLDKLKTDETKLYDIQKAFPNKLRASLLQSAIQGQLTEQLPEDGNARDLLKEIEVEKARLIEEKVIKKEKPLPPITDEEIPFEIPENWVWVRLGDVTIINPKNKIDDDLDTAFIPMAHISDGYRNEFIYDVKKWKDIKKGFTHFANNDLVIAKITPCFQNRKSTVLHSLPNGFGAGTTELHVVRVIENLVNPLYLLYLSKSDAFINNGVANFTGTAGQQRIGKNFVSQYLLPLPPLAEQQRIVEKLDEILGKVDGLKKIAE